MEQKEFFAEETRLTVSALEAARREDSFVFALLTDTHLSDTGDDTAANIHAVDARVPFRCAVHMGDFLNGFNPPRLSERLLREECAMYAAATAGGQLLVTQGNHDGYRDETVDGQNVPCVKPNDWFCRATDVVERIPGLRRPGTVPWYYVDYDAPAVRLIVLCSMDYACDESRRRYDLWDGFCRDQVDWLIEALATAGERTVLLFSHIPPYGESSSVRHGEAALGIVAAAAAGERYFGEGFCAEFRERPVRIAGWFYGHIHGDAVRQVKGVNFVCTASETAYIPQLWNPEPGGAFPSPRTLNTVYQDCWDAVTLSPAEGTLKLVRFGAGEDREIRF